LPTDPDDPAAPLRQGVEAQSAMCFENIHLILDHAGYGLEDSVFVRIYLKEFERDFATFNRVYTRHFPQDKPLPSRTTVGVSALGRGALVEVDLVCFKANQR
jgi:enamine deaminase RidA (YjgF/YER057c/UK114 family)